MSYGQKNKTKAYLLSWKSYVDHSLPKNRIGPAKKLCLSDTNFGVIWTKVQNQGITLIVGTLYRQLFDWTPTTKDTGVFESFGRFIIVYLD